MFLGREIRDRILHNLYYNHETQAAGTTKFIEKLEAALNDFGRLVKHKHLSLHDVIDCARKDSALYQLYVNKILRKHFGRYDSKIVKSLYAELKNLVINTEYDELCGTWYSPTLSCL